jgi:TrmH family RNA methyltransferase
MTGVDVGDWFQGTVLSGSLVVALPVALVAGLVSFFSPCVVPLLPGYLSYATGLSGADLESARRGRFERIACLDMKGDPIQSPGFKSFDCYVFGNEARGIPREQLTPDAKAFSIPGSGAIESLTLASAVNVCAYEMRR